MTKHGEHVSRGNAQKFAFFAGRNQMKNDKTQDLESREYMIVLMDGLSRERSEECPDI